MLEEIEEVKDIINNQDKYKSYKKFSLNIEEDKQRWNK